MNMRVIKDVEELVEYYEHLYEVNVACSSNNPEFILISIQERLNEDKDTLEKNGFVEVF